MTSLLTASSALDVAGRVRLGVAEPLRLGQRRGVVERVASSVIELRMKLVVPLTMPRTRSMRLPARSDASGPRTGIPPPTAASKRSAAPVRRAIASSSGP